MCQIVIILKDLSESPGAYRAGEIVTIVEDAHEFSPLELSHPRWRVVRVPGLPASALQSFALGDLVSRGMWRRAHHAGQTPMDYLRAGSGPITLTPRQAMELLTTFEVRYAD